MHLRNVAIGECGVLSQTVLKVKFFYFTFQHLFKCQKSFKCHFFIKIPMVIFSLKYQMPFSSIQILNCVSIIKIFNQSCQSIIQCGKVHFMDLRHSISLAVLNICYQQMTVDD